MKKDKESDVTEKSMATNRASLVSKLFPLPQGASPNEFIIDKDGAKWRPVLDSTGNYVVSPAGCLYVKTE